VKKSRIRSGRFVSTWKVCCRASAMTMKMRMIWPSVTHSPKRSVMLQTNTRRGFDQRSGCPSVFSAR
jgi:hypothetical protein